MDEAQTIYKTEIKTLKKRWQHHGKSSIKHVTQPGAAAWREELTLETSVDGPEGLEKMT